MPCHIPKPERHRVSTDDDVAKFGAWPCLSDEAALADPGAEGFTDGSCLDNGKPTARGSLGVYFGPNDPNNVSQCLTDTEPQTNNRGEMTAILMALRRVEPILQRRDCVVIIYTDSAYSIGMFGDGGRRCRSRGWKTAANKPAANVDLIKLALEWRFAYGTHIVFTHVNAHTNKQDALSVGNHHADRFAVAGAEQFGITKPKFQPVGPYAGTGADIKA